MLYKEPWFFERNSHALKRNYNFLWDMGYSLKKRPLEKTFESPYRCIRKKMIIWILSQNSIVEHFWSEFIYFSIVRYNCGNWKMLHGRVIKFHSFTTGTKCSSVKNQIFSGQDFPVDEEWCWSDTNWLVKIQRWFLIFQIW